MDGPEPSAAAKRVNPLADAEPDALIATASSRLRRIAFAPEAKTDVTNDPVLSDGLIYVVETDPPLYREMRGDDDGPWYEAIPLTEFPSKNLSSAVHVI